MRFPHFARHRILIPVFAIFALSTIAFGQYQDRALERARSVKMLTDDREAVRKIFHDFNLDDSDGTSDEFSFGETRVEVTYSSGTCDEDEREVWDVAAGRVIKVEVSESAEWRVVDLKLNLSKLEKEQNRRDDEGWLIFHSKKQGIAVEISDDEVASVLYFPSISSKAKSCSSKAAREFIEHKSWFGSRTLDERSIVCRNDHADVTALVLSSVEIEPLGSKVIGVTTTAVDPENDILTYNYTVTGGKIFGTGAKVQWDLTGVRSGKYTITAGVDDGCGICGATMTKAVVVK